MQQETIFTERAPKPAGFYSQGVKAGPFLFISGQLPFDSQGKVSAQTAGEQTTQTLRNIQAIVEGAGGKLDQLVQVTIYVSDIGFWKDVNAAYAEFLKDVPVRPARAVVPVKDLHYGAKLEIQAVAYMP